MIGDRRAAAVEPGLLFDALNPASLPALKPLDHHLVGAVGRTVTLGPGETTTFEFVLTWWFPQYGQVKGEMSAIAGMPGLKRHYVRRFASAGAVAGYVADHFDRLAGQTRLWTRTW